MFIIIILKYFDSYCLFPFISCIRTRKPDPYLKTPKNQSLKTKKFKLI